MATILTLHRVKGSMLSMDEGDDNLTALQATADRALEIAMGASQNAIAFGDGFTKTFSYVGPAITRMDWQGTQALYTTARTNGILYSENLADAGWVKVGSAITANATVAPDGTTTADLLTEDGTTNYHFVYRDCGGLALGQGYGFSFYAKAHGRTKIKFECVNTSQLTPGPVFDLTTGLVTSNAGRMVSMGNGWWRCYAEGVATAAPNANYQLRLVQGYTTDNYAGDGTSGVYLWGAQVEPTGVTTDTVWNVTVEGDSISAQPGSGPWPTLLGLAGVSQFTDNAVSGAKTADMVTRYDTYKANARTHFVVMGGTNDFLQDVPLATIQANLSYMWSDAKARGAVVVAMTVPPCQGYTSLWTVARQVVLNALNAWIRAQAAANGYILVDINVALGDPASPTFINPTYDSGDHLHPNLAGGHAIRDAVAKAILIPGTSPTAYLGPTAGTGLTVTDYTVAAGFATLAQVPAIGAVLRGVAARQVFTARASTNNGATTTFTYPVGVAYQFLTTSAASLAVTLPATSAALDGQAITLVPSASVASATWIAGAGGASIVGAPAALVANQPVRMIYDHGTTKWCPC